MSKDTCLFCRIINKDIPAKVIFEDDDILVFEDIHPQAPVHMLIIPKYHIERIADLTDKNAQLVWNLVATCKKIAKERKIEESGYRIVANCNKDAGQEVFHLHLHLLGGRKFSWPPG